MKSVLNRVLVLTVIAMCAVAVQAQTTILKADIPFNFNIGDQQMSSGSYVVRTVAENIQCWQDENGGQTIMVRTTPKSSLEYVAPKVVFHRYGDQYVLAEFWANSGHELEKSRLEKRLAQTETHQIVAVLLRPAK